MIFPKVWRLWGLIFALIPGGIHKVSTAVVISINACGLGQGNAENHHTSRAMFWFCTIFLWEAKKCKASFDWPADSHECVRKKPSNFRIFPKTLRFKRNYYGIHVQYSRWRLSLRKWEGSCLSRERFGMHSTTGTSMPVVTDNLVSLSVRRSIGFMQNLRLWSFFLGSKLVGFLGIRELNFS